MNERLHIQHVEAQTAVDDIKREHVKADVSLVRNTMAELQHEMDRIEQNIETLEAQQREGYDGAVDIQGQLEALRQQLADIENDYRSLAKVETAEIASEKMDAQTPHDGGTTLN